MKKLIFLLAVAALGLFRAHAAVPEPDNVIYGTIALAGEAVTSADTNVVVSAGRTLNGPAIASYQMGTLPSAGNYYSLRIPLESLLPVVNPAAALSDQIVYLSVSDNSGVEAQTTVVVGGRGAITLVNFGSSSALASGGSPGALTVTLLPPGAAAEGAQWQVDSGPSQTSGATVTNLTPGSHVISFTPVSGWNTPPNQINVTITSGVTTMASGIYGQTNAALVLLTNGYGTIQRSWPKTLVINKTYKMKAVPMAKNVFVNWVGGTSQPYAVLSSSASYSFMMQSNLVLEANFETNVFLAAAGTYTGLFAPTNAPRQQTNSGSFTLAVNNSGALSGSLALGGETVSFSGKFDSDGTADIASKASAGKPSLNISLQLDWAGQSISGTVSNNGFIAELSGNRSLDKAAAFAGQYTLVIPGTTNSALGPFGYSYGIVKVSASGTVTLSGSLADGTPISQSSTISEDGYWPLYVNLYGGNGSLWGWNYFTNGTIVAAPSLSWINATNSSKTAAYRSGFTNPEAMLTGGIYISSNRLPPGATVTLVGSNVPAITVANVADNTNKLTLKTNKSTGVITGSFANPDDPKQLIKIQGAILQGQTNAQGYFLDGDQSGMFLLTPAAQP